MKLVFPFALSALAAPCFARNATPSPRKNPLAGFENTSLDKRPNTTSGWQHPPPLSPPFHREIPRPPETLAPGATGLNFQAKTVANGGGMMSATAPESVAPVKTETRASHPVFRVDVHNFPRQPANAHLDRFFVASGSNMGRGANSSLLHLA